MEELQLDDAGDDQQIDSLIESYEEEMDLNLPEIYLDKISLRNLDDTSARQKHRLVDHNHVIFLCFLFCGCGILFPYSAFVSAVDYFEAEYSSAAGVLYYISIFNLVCNSMTSISLLFFISKFSLSARIFFSYLLSIASLLLFILVQAISSFYQFKIAHQLTLWSLFALSSVQGLVTGLQQGSFYGMASLFPAPYLQALMNGGGIAGLLAASLRLITKACFRGDPKTVLLKGVYFYFSLCGLIILLSFWCYVHLKKSRFCLHYLSKATSANHLQQRRNSFANPSLQSSYESLAFLDHLNHSFEAGVDGFDLQNPPDSFLSKHERHQLANLDSHSVSQSRSLWKLVKMIRYPFASIFFTSFITLSVFPGIITQISSQKLGDWFPILMILIFNFADLLGKILARWQFGSLFSQLCFSLLRIVFIPLFMLCVSSFSPITAPQNDSLHSNHPFFLHESWPVSFCFFFALLGAYSASVAFIEAPRLVSSSLKETAGALMVFSCLFGLTLGSFFALWLKSLM
eukprot:Sdes_comp20529_c0_seq1m15191